MRITKAMLCAELESSKSFQRCKILRVKKRDEEALRARQGFLSPCQYGRGQIPLKNEIGRVGMERYVTEKLEAWAPTITFRRSLPYDTAELLKAARPMLKLKAFSKKK